MRALVVSVAAALTPYLFFSAEDPSTGRAIAAAAARLGHRGFSVASVAAGRALALGLADAGVARADATVASRCDPREAAAFADVLGHLDLLIADGAAWPAAEAAVDLRSEVNLN